MNMARPIRETPILVDKDAERFVKEKKRNEASGKFDSRAEKS